jgi:hypothetical protein
MGLLSKADPSSRAAANGSNAPELDEMGKALRDRIRRLPPKKSSPSTALSLMKAYASFQAGICLSLSRGVYYSYAAVGLGMEKVSVKKEMIYSPQAASKNCFKLEGGFSSLGIPFRDVWVFPLDKASPWNSVLILFSDGSPLFNSGIVILILEGIQDIINPQIDRVIQRESSSEKAAKNGETPINGFLAQFHRLNPSFSGIVLGPPQSLNSPGIKPEGDFCKKLSRMVSLFGAVFSSPAGKSIVLIPANLDRDLIAHQLKASLKTEIETAFNANSREEALKKLGPYL